MYIYYCKKCQNLEAFADDNLIQECSECGEKLLPLHKTVDEWNELSNKEMINIIENAKQPYSNGLKMPRFDANIDNKKVQDYCPHCGAELDSNATFCIKCGRSIFNTPRKKNKKNKAKSKLPIIAMIIALILLVVGGGIFLFVRHQKIKEQQRVQAMREYYQKANEIVELIDEGKHNFDGIGIILKTAVESKTGLLGVDFFIDYAKALCSSEIAQERTRKSTVDKLMEEFNAMECPAEQMNSLHDAVKEYKDSYNNRFDILIEGNFSSYDFNSKNNSSSSDIESKKMNVTNELEKYMNLEESNIDGESESL